MTEYWISGAKFWCEYCKIYIADNKSSRGLHENGKKHKENMETFLGEMRVRNHQKELEQKDVEREMKRIEEAAERAYRKDVKAAAYAAAGVTLPEPEPLPEPVPLSGLALELSQASSDAYFVAPFIGEWRARLGKPGTAPTAPQEQSASVAAPQQPAQQSYPAPYPATQPYPYPYPTPPSAAPPLSSPAVAPSPSLPVIAPHIGPSPGPPPGVTPTTSSSSSVRPPGPPPGPPPGLVAPASSSTAPSQPPGPPPEPPPGIAPISTPPSRPPGPPPGPPPGLTGLPPTPSQSESTASKPSPPGPTPSASPSAPLQTSSQGPSPPSVPFSYPYYAYPPTVSSDGKTEVPYPSPPATAWPYPSPYGAAYPYPYPYPYGYYPPPTASQTPVTQSVDSTAEETDVVATSKVKSPEPTAELPKAETVQQKSTLSEEDKTSPLPKQEQKRARADPYGPWVSVRKIPANDETQELAKPEEHVTRVDPYGPWVSTGRTTTTASSSEVGQTEAPSSKGSAYGKKKPDAAAESDDEDDDEEEEEGDDKQGEEEPAEKKQKTADPYGPWVSVKKKDPIEEQMRNILPTAEDIAKAEAILAAGCSGFGMVKKNTVTTKATKQGKGITFGKTIGGSVAVKKEAVVPGVRMEVVEPKEDVWRGEKLEVEPGGEAIAFKKTKAGARNFRKKDS